MDNTGMFEWFSRFTDAPSSAPGLERQILRQLPRALLSGTLAIALPSLVLHLAVHVYPALDGSRVVDATDFRAIGILIVYVIALLTVAIGAFTVVVMKGPVHTADSYHLSDAEQPPER